MHACADWRLTLSPCRTLPSLFRYLMVTVGCLYMRAEPAQARPLLNDLVEMCRGLQHPCRGLFLRAYLCQKSRGVLPPTGACRCAACAALLCAGCAALYRVAVVRWAVHSAAYRDSSPQTRKAFVRAAEVQGTCLRIVKVHWDLDRTPRSMQMTPPASLSMLSMHDRATPRRPSCRTQAPVPTPPTFTWPWTF